ncbi:uncharacterized protein LOC141630476 [Silene latifolia]|uniref:uncharacterized protein LOC141630476 n=1 Tax=Silene latifolia TaxID=37657 RepID=UPI003D77F5A3
MMKAHSTPYSVHPGGDKLYKDLKKTFWWPDGQTERTIKTLEDMLQACAMEFGGSWDDRLDLIEFSYNNSYHTNIGMTPSEASYDRKCMSPLCWDDSIEAVVLGPQMNIELDKALTYAELPKEILDRMVRKTRKGETVLLKMLWSNYNVEEATWEPEETVRECYPHLFEQLTNPFSVVAKPAVIH